MPYRGKPSLGCHTCRRRKIKCDRGEPGCFNCEKAGWKCGGYRDVTDLLFHDESTRVVEKAKAARASSRRNRVVAESTEATESRPHSLSPTKEVELQPEQQPGRELPRTEPVAQRSSPRLDPQPELGDLAVAYFYRNYVFSSNGSEKYLAINGNGCLLAAIKAVGTAGVTRTGPGPSTSAQAQEQYYKAIQFTNVALRSEAYVRLDSTLLAINILGIFESVTGFNRSLSSWQEHVTGAAALLHLRGKEQFNTATGGLLYSQTVTNLVICCIQRRIPLPDDVLEILPVGGDDVPDPADRIWRWHLVNYHFAQLHATLLPSNHPRFPQDVTRILKAALAIEEDIIDMSTNVPPEWEYQRVQAEGPAVYSGFYFVFQTFFQAQTWCALWCTRILLIDIMLKALHCCPALAPLELTMNQRARLQNAEGIVRLLQRSIFAAVPQHVGTSFSQVDSCSTANGKPSLSDPWVDIWTKFASRDSNPWRTRPTPQPELPFVRMSGGYMIHWPLFVAGAVGAAGSPERTWAQQVLRNSGQNMGHQQALVLANWLESDHGITLITYKGIPGGLAGLW